MSEQKFYKKMVDKWFNPHTQENECDYDFVEATPEDFEKAGWVKREKVKPVRKKIKRSGATFIESHCPDCKEYLGSAWICCPGCGSELIWKE